MESNELPSATITPNDDPLCSLQPAGTDEQPFHGVALMGTRPIPPRPLKGRLRGPE